MSGNEGVQGRYQVLVLEDGPVGLVGLGLLGGLNWLGGQVVDVAIDFATGVLDPEGAAVGIDSSWLRACQLSRQLPKHHGIRVAIVSRCRVASRQ